MKITGRQLRQLIMEVISDEQDFAATSGDEFAVVPIDPQSGFSEIARISREASMSKSLNMRPDMARSYASRVIDVIERMNIPDEPESPEQINEFVDPVTAGLLGALAVALISRKPTNITADKDAIVVNIDSKRASLMSMGLGEVLAMAGLGAAAAQGGVGPKLKELWNKLKGNPQREEMSDSIDRLTGEEPAALDPEDIEALFTALEGNPAFSDILDQIRSAVEDPNTPPEEINMLVDKANEQISSTIESSPDIINIDDYRSLINQEPDNQTRVAMNENWMKIAGIIK